MSKQCRGLLAIRTECEADDAALACLTGLGFDVFCGTDIGPESQAPERGSCGEALEDALRRVRQAETPSPIEEKRRLHSCLVERCPDLRAHDAVVVASGPAQSARRE